MTYFTISTENNISYPLVTKLDVNIASSNGAVGRRWTFPELPRYEISINYWLRDILRLFNQLLAPSTSWGMDTARVLTTISEHADVFIPVTCYRSVVGLISKAEDVSLPRAVAPTVGVGLNLPTYGKFYWIFVTFNFAAESR